VLADRYVYTAFARDVTRGVHPQWVRGLYSFAVQPTVGFYFRVSLEESLRRIVHGRPQLKYYEAGLDLGLSSDPYESFSLFQGQILQEYDKIVDEFGLTVIDATLPLTEQQEMIREIVAPYLKGVLKAERSAWRDALTQEHLYGRYLKEIGTERGQV
jgi:dTMP kinase